MPIHVIQRGPPTIVSHGGDGDNFGGGMTPEQSAAQGDKVVRISYHKRMYGLGEVSVLETVEGLLGSCCSTTTRCGSPNDGLQPDALRIMQHHESLTEKDTACQRLGKRSDRELAMACLMQEPYAYGRRP